MVDCVQPRPGESITDPACGTGGFLIAAHAHIIERYEEQLYGDQARKLQTGAITGYELVRETARLALMNMLLHGIGTSEARPLITVQDSLAKPPHKFYRTVSRYVSETVAQGNRCTKHSLGPLAPRVTLGYCHVSQSMGRWGDRRDASLGSPRASVDRTGDC